MISNNHTRLSETDLDILEHIKWSFFAIVHGYTTPHLVIVNGKTFSIKLTLTLIINTKSLPVALTTQRSTLINTFSSL